MLDTVMIGRLGTPEIAGAAGLLLGAPFWVVYLCALMEDVQKCILGIFRARSVDPRTDSLLSPGA
jgi:hypothetical protein